MALGVRKACGEKRARDLGSGLDADHPCAQAEDVQVVILDALPRRERVVAERGARSRHLVDRDRHPDAAATDQDAALRSTLDDRRRDRARKSG